MTALYASPRSLLSTPRSILSTPRSLLSAQRREWRAAAAAQAELFRSWGGSVRREELKQLTRKQLRQRLLDLGAAPTEGEGMHFATLVDTVLFWNALARIHDGGGLAEREEALLALRDSGLPSELLQRALMVVRVPVEERRRLKQQAAADLLYERLLPLLAADAECGGREEAACGAKEAEASLRSEEAQSRWRQKVLEAEDEEPRPNLEVIVGDVSTKVLVEAPCSSHPSVEQLARDSKFEALDADLRRSLEEIEELDDAAIPEASGQPPAWKPQVGGRNLPPIEEDVGAEGTLLASAQRSLGFPGPEVPLAEGRPALAEADGALLGGAIDEFMAASARSSRTKTPR